MEKVWQCHCREWETELTREIQHFQKVLTVPLKLGITYLQSFPYVLLRDFLSSAWLLESRPYRKFIDCGPLVGRVLLLVSYEKIKATHAWG